MEKHIVVSYPMGSVWSRDLWRQHHLGASWECIFPGPAQASWWRLF